MSKADAGRAAFLSGMRGKIPHVTWLAEVQTAAERGEISAVEVFQLLTENDNG